MKTVKPAPWSAWTLTGDVAVLEIGRLFEAHVIPARGDQDGLWSWNLTLRNQLYLSGGLAVSREEAQRATQDALMRYVDPVLAVAGEVRIGARAAPAQRRIQELSLRVQELEMKLQAFAFIGDL